MSIANKTNLLIAVRGYTDIKKQTKPNCIDISALDNTNKKVLLRIIDRSGNPYVDLNDVKNLAETIKSEAYDSSVLISTNFTEAAINEMLKQNIQYVSESYMPPFAINDVYLAIVNCASNQCMKKCGITLADNPDCIQKAADHCKILTLIENAKEHFEQGTIGLLKNDLKTAIALNK